jgi:hypothetical protein
MFELDPGLLKALLVAAFSAGGVYAAIRADIKNIHSKIANVEKDVDRVENNVTRAHMRLDDHVVDYHRKGA